MDPTWRKIFKILKIQTSNLFDTLQSLPDDSISKFNLSNIFDWMDDQTFIQCLKEICRVGKKGGCICYFCSRLDRGIPLDFKGIQTDRKLVNQLITQDRTIYYGHVEVAKVKKT